MKTLLIGLGLLFVTVPVTLTLAVLVGWLVIFIVEPDALSIFSTTAVARWVAASVYLVVVAAGWNFFGEFEPEKDAEKESE